MTYHEDMKLRGFKQLLHMIKSGEEAEMRRDGVGEHTAERQLGNLGSQEKIKTTIKEVLEFNESKQNKHSKNKHSIGLTEP